MIRRFRPLRSMRLCLFSTTGVVLVPLMILACVVALSVVIALLIGIGTGLPLPPAVATGMASNMGAIFSVPGFLIGVGALTVNRLFATAVAFGSTRRDFWIGSTFGFVVISLVTGVGSVLLLWLEQATNHWFIGARALDVAMLGSGNAWQTFVTITVLSLCSLFLGAGFGTLFRAYGPRGAVAAGVVLGLVVCAGLAAAIWRWQDLAPTVATLGAWLLPIGTGVLGVLAALGSYWANRRATL